MLSRSRETHLTSAPTPANDKKCPFPFTWRFYPNDMSLPEDPAWPNNTSTRQVNTTSWRPGAIMRLPTTTSKLPTTTHTGNMRRPRSTRRRHTNTANTLIDTPRTPTAILTSEPFDGDGRPSPRLAPQPFRLLAALLPGESAEMPSRLRTSEEFLQEFLQGGQPCAFCTSLWYRPPLT